MGLVQHVMIMLLSCAVHVSGQFTCPHATSYEGSFSSLDDVTEGHFLEGFTYRNLSGVRSSQSCFSACTSDCRCQAYQVMRGTSCELLDENRTSMANSFKANPGYDYYDLIQRFKSGGQIQSSNCNNGCCLDPNACNGGTCVETCSSPKVKYNCSNCPLHFTGKYCDQYIPPWSCGSYFFNVSHSHSQPVNGVYNITDGTGTGSYFPVYCAFDAPNNKAWTLIESYALKHKDSFVNKAFVDDFPVNEATPNQENYRLSLQRMRLVRTHAVSYRVTCAFWGRAENVTDRDYLEGGLAEFDIINYDSGSLKCAVVRQVDVGGYSCRGCTFPVYQQSQTWHFHSEPIACSFHPPGYEAYYEVFGYYNPPNPQFICSTSPDATTQVWLGQEK